MMYRMRTSQDLKHYALRTQRMLGTKALMRLLSISRSSWKSSFHDIARVDVLLPHQSRGRKRTITSWNFQGEGNVVLS